MADSAGANRPAADGAVAGQHPPLGPARLATPEVGRYCELYFPWELDNADYLRRVLMHAGATLATVRSILIAASELPLAKKASPCGNGGGRADAFEMSSPLLPDASYTRGCTTHGSTGISTATETTPLCIHTTSTKPPRGSHMSLYL